MDYPGYMNSENGNTKRCLLCGARLAAEVSICPCCGSVKFESGESVPVLFPQTGIPQNMGQIPTAPNMGDVPFMTIPPQPPAKKKTNKARMIFWIVFGCLAVMMLTISIVNTLPCNHDYESEVISEPSYAGEGEIKYTCTKCDDTYSEYTPCIPSPLQVTVLDKDQGEDYSSGYDPFTKDRWILFKTKLENTSDRAIQSATGTLYISQNGRTLMEVYCTFTQPVPAHSSIVLDDFGVTIYSWEWTSVINGDSIQGVYYADYSSLQFSFALENIAYAG